MAAHRFEATVNASCGCRKRGTHGQHVLGSSGLGVGGGVYAFGVEE